MPKASFFSRLMHPKRTYLTHRARVLESRINTARAEAKRLDRLWRPEEITYIGKLGKVCQKLGRHREARELNNRYLERLLDMGGNMKEYVAEMKACWLLPDRYGTEARKLARQGRYAAAAKLYKKQAEEYGIIGTNNIFMLPEEAFRKSIITKTVDLEMMALMPSHYTVYDRIMLEDSIRRNQNRYAIAGIARERAKAAWKNAEAALAKLGEQTAI